MAEAIENIAHPLGVLKGYIEKNGMGTFSDEECGSILQKLPQEPFEQTEHSFKANLRTKIRDLAYSKKVRQLLAAWKEKTGVENISAWTAEYRMPIAWGMPGCEDLFSVIAALEKHERIDEIRLDNAIAEAAEWDLSVLSDRDELDRRFILNVASRKFTGILLPHVTELKEKLQNSGYRNYAQWDQQLVAIRPVVESYITTELRAEVSDRAKKRVSEMNSVDQLKKQLERILEQSAEACLLMLDEK